MQITTGLNKITMTLTDSTTKHAPLWHYPTFQATIKLDLIEARRDQVEKSLH